MLLVSILWAITQFREFKRIVGKVSLYIATIRARMYF